MAANQHGLYWGTSQELDEYSHKDKAALIRALASILHEPSLDVDGVSVQRPPTDGDFCVPGSGSFLGTTLTRTRRATASREACQFRRTAKGNGNGNGNGKEISLLAVLNL
ncbi:hypothetical protein ACIQZB_25320 [Streptomyces sp. NPDC097727]|uniref:hypothetical protein n=1 Tax=Streptomyces sp. NPDC097727 TaxID=3366092 RepID=UPI00380341F8